MKHSLPGIPKPLPYYTLLFYNSTVASKISRPFKTRATADQNCNDVRLVSRRGSDELGVAETLTSADVPGAVDALTEPAAATGGAGGGAGAGAEISTGATLPHQLTLFFPSSMAS